MSAFDSWLEQTWEFMELTPPGGRIDMNREEFIAALKEAYQAGATTEREEWRIEREPRDESEFKVSRVYTVQNKFGEDGENVHFSLEEAIEFLGDWMGTKTGTILDAHTDEIVAHVAKGKIKLVGKQNETQ